ncbi:DUF167 domain-containing protein [Candidatus Micrarchaeota archaeon]|nr:DUF167 domain-containing protein [Candidatus Micrarchaeota archaeon]
MKLWVKVFPKSREDKVIVKDNIIEVRVKEPADKNKANIAVVKLLKKHFGADVRLVSGATSRRKLVEVMY